MFKKRVGELRFSAVAIALIMCLSMAWVAGDRDSDSEAPNAKVTSEDEGVVGREMLPTSTVDAIDDTSSDRTVGYWWHNMFNESFGEWWDWRYDYYGDWEVVSDTYPYIYRKLGGDGADAYYSSMQLNVMADSLPEVNMNSNPVFLPFLGDERGGTAVIDWYMQYLTEAEIQMYPDASAAWSDGWIVGLNGTTFLDSTAAMAVLGITDDGLDNFESWWAVNSADVNMEYIEWMLYEGNERLDIFPMYDYMFTPLAFNLDAYSYDGNVVLEYDIVSWGMEALMTRWLHDAFMPTEWMFEDFRLHAEIYPDLADIDVDTAVVGAVFAWKDIETQLPSWAWRGMLQDYVPSNLAHPISDFDTYAPLECVDMYAGSTSYGEMIPYGYTPGSFNLADGEEMWFEWPDGAQTFVVDGEFLDFTTAEYGMTSPYSEPSEYDLPPNVVVDPVLRTLTFEGPMDVYSWSQDQTDHDYLESEWDRLGVLPYGMPWVEFGASSEPPVPIAMVMDGVPDAVRVNQTAGFIVTVLDQYGSPYEDYTGTVRFSSSDLDAILPADYTFIAADAGAHYFEAVFFSEELQSVTVTDVADPLFTATAWTTVLPLADGKQWTVLVYLDADNNLEEVGLTDFIEMASVGSTEDVNIVVQFDRISGYDSSYGDWTGTNRFYVTPDMTSYASNAVEELGELNMGDPETLSDFITWGVANYPAEDYMLVLWDHGGGWDGAVCWDETDMWDALTMDEVETALSDAQAYTGQMIDVLGYDACLMAMAEVVYETKEYVDYVVASEEMVPWDGWPYDAIMADLVSDPIMSPAELSSSIVTRYMEYYGTYGMETISAVDVAVAEDMFLALDVFAQELIYALPDHEEIIQYCRMNSTTFYDGTFLDLYDFAFEVGDIYTTPELLAAADVLWAAVSATVIAEGHGDYYWDAHGVSIYFPMSADGYWTNYEDILDFTADTSWDEFLVTYLTVEADEYEPDDVYTDATELIPDIAQTHNILIAEDVDWLAFSLSSEDDVRIRTEGTYGQWGDTLMWLYDEAGVPYTEIAFNDNWGYEAWAVIDTHLGPGTYYVKVGAYYQIDSYDVTLFVGELPNEPPAISIGIYPWPVAGVPSTYDASYSYDPDGWIVSYLWDFGDGTTEEGAVVEHIYDASGMYALSLTLVDDDGAESAYVYDIYVEEPSEPDAYEPDDTYDQASSIELGETQEHSIAPGGGDIDWVTFTLTDDTDVEIMTSTDSENWGDTVVALYDEAGVPYSWIAFDDDSGENLASRIAVALSAGTYWVEVWAFGYYDEISSYYLSLSETEIVNQPPYVYMYWWPQEPAPGQEACFYGWDSYDPDGWITDWIWDFGDGSTGEGYEVNHTFEEAGEYMVTLTVIDNAGESASTSSWIWVHENDMPVAYLTCSPENPAPGELVYFDASDSYDPDGWIEYFYFDFGDGTSDWVYWPETWHTYYYEGVYTVILTVYDSNWVSNSTSMTIRVGGEASPPVAIIGYEPSLPLVGETVTFDASESFDPDGTITTYIWQFGDGDVAHGLTVAHAYEHEGVYDVKLTVMDGDLLVDEDVVSITVASVPIAAMMYSPQDPVEEELVTFYAYGSYDESGIVEYVWSFGDGTYAIGWEAEHAYLQKGDYEVTLTVTNTYGIQTSVTQAVDVGKGSNGVKGIVLSENLRPIKNAAVEIRTAGGTLVGCTLTDNHGEFSIRDLEAGMYELSISKSGYAGVTVSITISDGVLDAGSLVMQEDMEAGTNLATPEDEALWMAGAAALVGIALVGGIAAWTKRRDEIE